MTSNPVKKLDRLGNQSGISDRDLDPQAPNQAAFPITHILVPQGAEHQAVCQGLATYAHPPKVQAIPLGLNTWVPDFLEAHFLCQVSPRSGVLLMGLAGGLDPMLAIGAGLLYEGCYDLANHWQSCDDRLRKWLAQRLQENATVVKGLTCDRIIYQAQEKIELYQRTGLSAVDMEGYSVLNTLNAAQVPTAIVRVISDTHRQNLPNIAPAIAVDGRLNPWTLSWQFAQNPIAALHLIRSSLLGLEKLRSLTQQIFQEKAVRK
jgi:hypothetical protein